MLLLRASVKSGFQSAYEHLFSAAGRRISRWPPDRYNVLEMRPSRLAAFDSRRRSCHVCRTMEPRPEAGLRCRGQRR